jgi:hypothetical protein
MSASPTTARRRYIGVSAKTKNPSAQKLSLGVFNTANPADKQVEDAAYIEGYLYLRSG